MDLVVVTDYKKAFRQGLKRYNSLNKIKFYNELEKFNIKITEYSYSDLANNNSIKLKNQNIIYTSSQELDYKKYIENIIYNLSLNNNIIPTYDFLLAHENKGYQELLKNKLELKSLNYKYFSSLKEIIENLNNISFPLVLKKVNGAGSSNVFLVKCERELIKRVKKINNKKRLFHKSRYIIKKAIKKLPNDSEFYTEDPYLGELVIQDFLPNLKEDWKVLVFFDKFYVLNRKVRKKDFRASGSGDNSYVRPPKKVLNYARRLIASFDVPFISLDIAHDGKNCYLIEFQAMHFGPITLLNSNHYYHYDNNKWTKVFETCELENEYARSISCFLKKQS